jgi:amino acid adenylation domain-containing protein
MIDSSGSSAQKHLLLQWQLSGAGGEKRSAGAAPRQPGEWVPISAEQKDIWLHAAMAPEIPLYNEAFTIHRRGPFDRAAMERSFAELLRRHEIWRTSFVTTDGELRQIVHPELRLEIAFVDLSDRPEDEREQAALAIATTDARQPFDLARVPLLRARIVRLAPEYHRLYLALHHLIFDSVSICRTIVPELAALYAAYAQGREPAIAPPALQYGDYALWRARQLSASTMRREIEYWRQQLAGELPFLQLPTDRPRVVTPSHRGGTETFSLSPELTAALKMLARTEGVTLYVVLLAAFKALLHRYSGQDDIVIGGVTDMRRRPELAGVVGYFLNGLALRTRPTAKAPFRAYLGEVQDTVLGAIDASGVPFARVVREVRPRRDGGAHPIFQILFSMQPPPPAVDDGWDLTQMDITAGAAKFDLTLEVEERSDVLVGRFLYSSDLFDAPRIQRMIGHWTTLLHGVVENPQCALGRLPLLSPQEARTLLVEVNATARDYPRTTLPAWFDAQARQTPDAIAVEYEGRTWRYRDLSARVQQLAARLRAAGVGREGLVAVMLDRSFDMVAALLAILQAGGAYLPLDPQLPPARLAMLVEDARPDVLLTQSALLDRIPQPVAKVIVCDAASSGDETGRETRQTAEPDDLAYVLFTSGSTGRPKAVEICHRSLVNVLAAVRDELDFDAHDGMLAVTTLSFDIAALELFLPLVTGGRLLLASRAEAADPARLMTRLREPRCTVMQATPATWRGLIAAGWPGSSELRILCGGETLQPELAAQLLQRCKAVWNMYGPTETTIWSLLHKVRPDEDPVPIGRPLANTSVYVLDANDEPAPAGTAGELFIGGAGVARGYRNEAALTERKFVTVAAVPGQRLYRTGDTVRFRADGTLDFLGRTDNQVKVRGFRVGLEEVEAAIAAHPAIAAGAVRAFTDASGESGLAAFIVPRSNDRDERIDLRRFLARSLPDYMIPTRCVVLSALPQTANGKVDRGRLAVPSQAVAHEVSEPRDELEQVLTDIWKSLLGIPAVDIHDNFFEIGGHSLLAAMMAAKINELLGRELPLAALLRAPTIASLAELLRSDTDHAFAYLVGLRTQGTGRPLYIVHGMFGNVLQFRALAERLRTDRPIYALQARGVHPRQEPHATIAEMAAAYLDAIRTHQPAGPYALAGYSYGGLVALEMACRLREAGEEVDLLALFETNVHPRNLPLAEWLSYHWSPIGRCVRKLKALPLRHWPDYLKSKVAPAWRRVLLRLELTEPGTQEAREMVLARNRQIYKLSMRQFNAYRPRRFGGKISVFRTAGERLDVCDPLPVWRRVADAVEVFDIAGTHGTIMENRNVGTLAAQLDLCLARLDSRSASEVRVTHSASEPRDGPQGATAPDDLQARAT